MTREAAILTTLILYQLVLIGIGLLASRRTHDGEDYYLGGRRLGPLVAAISASASSSSAWTLLGVSGFAFRYGVVALWLFPACVGGFLFNWFVLAPRMRRASKTNHGVTIPEFIAEAHGGELRRPLLLVSSGIILFSLTAYVAAQFQAAGLSFEESFGTSPILAITIGAAIVVFYTLLGGFWAVSLTDTLQGILMAVTAIVLPVVAVVKVGGIDAFVSGVGAVDLPGFQSPIHGLPLALGLGFVFGLLGIGLGYPGQPHVSNRFLALREGEGELRKARRYALIWAFLIYGGMIVLGLAGRVLYSGIGNQEKIFFVIANRLFPPVLAGVMVAASLSAIMSTADSQLLVAASAITNDLRKKRPSAARQLRESRIVVLVISVVATICAIYLTKEIFNSVLFAWSAMGAAFGPVLLVSLGRRVIRGRGKLLSICSGFLLSVGFYLLNLYMGSQWKLEVGAALERVVPFFVAFGIAWLHRVPPGAHGTKHVRH